MAEKEINRKVAIILATDVVNYSKHMEADESETVKNLRSCELILQQVIKKHDGRLFNTGGDSFFIEFPSAVEAVECAVAFQNEIKKRNTSDNITIPLEFRIGISMGDVIKEKENLLGDGVNIAARLEALAQTNGITISKNIYELVKAKTSHKYNDLGVQKVKKNEFHAFDILLHPSQKRKLKTQRAYSSLLGTITIIVAIGLGSFFYFNYNTQGTKSIEQFILESDRPMVLVMPFENRSGKSSDDQLSSGMTDIIISSLASYPRLFVQSSSTSNFIKQEGFNDKEIKDRYLVNYVLRGSNQVFGDKIRTIVELSDIVKETIVWSQKYDFTMNDIFAVQDEISSKILNKLQIKLTIGQSFDDSRKYFKDPENWQRFIKANSLWLTMSLEGVKEAGLLFDTIFETEPNNPVVLSMYAWYFTAQASVGLRDWNVGKDMVEVAKRAVKYGPKLSDGYSLLAGLMVKQPKEFPEYNEEELLKVAREYALKASALNPTDIISVLAAANSLFTLSLHEMAIENYEKALNIAPHPPANVKLNYSLALMYLKQYDKSYALATDLSENEQYFGGAQIGGLGIKTFIAMEEGRKNDARKYVERILKLDNTIKFNTLRRAMKTFFIIDKTFMKELKTKLIEAGIPA